MGRVSEPAFPWLLRAVLARGSCSDYEVTVMNDPLLLAFVDIARAASKVIMEVYARDFAIETKKDSSPVTEADNAAEAVILEGLTRFDSKLSVVAEESVSGGKVPSESSRFVLVDPLDGTKEFINKNGEFTVNLGLIEDGSPVAGVVLAPARGLIFAGRVGSGAWVAEDVPSGAPVFRSIRVRTPNPSALSVVASRSHLSPETKAFIERFPVSDWASAGSSFKFCKIASGEADLYPRHGRTMEWDTAAGDAVLRAAGGRVDTLDGKPLCYGKRRQTNDTDFANPFFVAANFDWFKALEG
jgi:3'(2'), 5'-bisphosphate nucleotidase